jgi:Holliday junction resolvase-like predicted endonuclease
MVADFESKKKLHNTANCYMAQAGQKSAVPARQQRFVIFTFVEFS